MSRRDDSLIADTVSLEALRRLRRGWAGWELADGEFRVRLRDGGTVRAIQYSGVPGFPIPQTAVAKRDFTDAVTVTSEGAGGGVPDRVRRV